MSRVVPSQVVKAIDELYPSRNNRGFVIGVGPESASQVGAILQLFEAIPPELIVLPGEKYTRLIVAISRLRTFVTNWSNQADRAFSLGPSSTLDGENPVVAVRDALAACPDEAPAKASHDLNFIIDPDLRQSLLADLGAIQVALANGEWKAATVLAGALTEALLLWALNNNLPKVSSAKHVRSGPLEHWDLHSYIEVAAEIQIIKESTAQQARIAKNFRNLIHPGRAIRLGQNCDQGTALSAAAAVYHVIRDIS
jgi:hypothetical protein